MFANIFITTMILWGISLLCVTPLCNYWIGKKLREPEFAHLNGSELDESGQSELKSIATKFYILADVVVLGIAGLIGGILGYQFIGISLEAKGWPGIVAFMIASSIGVRMVL